MIALCAVCALAVGILEDNFSWSRAVWAALIDKRAACRNWPSASASITAKPSSATSAPAKIMELTVIGDAVNLASRLEGLTKEYHLDLLLGETMAPLVHERFLLRTVDYVQVNGKTKPETVYTVIGARDSANAQTCAAWLQPYEEGVQLYRQRDFAGAVKQFAASLISKPDDVLSDIYRKRCTALHTDPPDASWNGVYVMTKK